MERVLAERVQETKAAALEVLLHNAYGPFDGLPRTAGWGYPEAYTRDWMLSALGALASGHPVLINAVRRVLESLAKHQTHHGHIPSLAHSSEDRGASDTTPLFLMGLALYRTATGELDFLDGAAHKALTWMDYQSPADDGMVAQLPTSDWRDEQWVLGYGLYVNMLTYIALCQFGQQKKARRLIKVTKHFVIGSEEMDATMHEGLVVPNKPYYALWAYKIYNSERFDLLGNSLAILAGVATPNRAKAIVRWVEDECDAMRKRGELEGDLPPNFFPFIWPSNPDWLPRYKEFNMPGDYHNGGIWPFICGFYVVAALAAGLPRLAEKKFAALTNLVRLARDRSLTFGFNEWVRAQDGTAQGNDWQTWSAALYLYAAACMEQGRALFFDDICACAVPEPVLSIDVAVGEG